MKLAIDVSISEEGETKLEFDPTQELLSSSKIQSMENERVMTDEVVISYSRATTPYRACSP